MRTKRLSQVISIFSILLFSVVSYAPCLKGETITIPGDISRICYYTDFFYNFPSDDFIYYLNERLLHSEKPDEVIIEKGLRDMLLEIVSWHQVIKEFMYNQTRG